MTTRQVAFRLKSEGKTEVLRDARDVGEAFKGSYQAAEQGAAAATSAADRLEQKYRRMAQAAQDSAQAQAAQARINATLGVREPARGSAAASASVFMQDDDDVRRAEALRAAIDPVTAAQNRLNHELKEYQTLANAGKITTGELAQLQEKAKTRYDETTAAIARNEKGLTRLALASRLNLARQGADVAVTAAMGMNPAMIAIQQGPQILDALATSGIKANGAVVALAAGVGGLAAGVGILGAAWLRGQDAAGTYEDATTGVGRTAGLTADQLRDLSVAAAESGGISRKAARDMAVEYLATGKIGGQVLGDLIEITRDYASFTGTDAEAATKTLAKAMEDPKKAAHEWTLQYGLLSQAQLTNIDNMIEEGDLMGAQKLLIEEVTKAAKGHADQVRDATDAWRAFGIWVSDAADRLGEFLYVTEDERLKALPTLIAAAQTPLARNRLQGEYDDRLLSSIAEDMLRENQQATAATNQQEERDRLAAEARDKKNAAAARSARAEARREASETERERKEALARTRREEDRKAQIALEEARARQDFGKVQQLEDANAVRVRERQLIDDNTSADVARNKALAEQARLIEARRETQAREIIDLGRQADLEIMREAGEARFVASRERAAEIESRIVKYRKNDMDLATAQNLVMSEMADLDAARAESARLAADAREREWKMTLAQASGDDRRLRALAGEDWIERRAREIESDAANPLNRGEGRDQATKEYGQLLRAQTTGAFRDGLGSFLDDIRSGGVRDALSNQFENAADRLLDKLIDGLLEIDFSGGSGKGGGDWLSKGINFLFGRNAEGTDYWTGGPTWVGERGPELLDLPRGSRVVENARSLDMMRKAASGGGGAPVIVQATYAPAHTINGVDTERLEAILAQDRAEFESRTIATVNEGISRRLIAS